MTEETKQKIDEIKILIKKFKKLAIIKREAKAKRLGYSSALDYLQYLDEQISDLENPKPVKKTRKPRVKKDNIKIIQEFDISKPAIDVVVAFDTTGSMSSYIDSVRNHVVELVGTLFKNTLNLKMKIVAFGDYCDMESPTAFGKAYQETQLTDNQNELVKFVTHAKNTSGGDGDEFYELVIKKIVEETPWRSDNKSVLLIGDANPHKVGYSYSTIVQNAQIDWRQEAYKAKEKGIQFDTLRIHNSVDWYKELSDITGGVCMEFDNANQISEVIEASTYVRGNKKEFVTKMDAAEKSGDEKLVGMYKSLSTLL